jgi:hypothetical protein
MARKGLVAAPGAKAATADQRKNLRLVLAQMV